MGSGCLVFSIELRLCRSVEDGAELALGKSAGKELVGNLIDILELEHESPIDGKVREASLVEVGKSLLEDRFALSLNLLVVELLGSLGINADEAVHELARRLAFAGGFSGNLLRLHELFLRLLHLLVSS